MKILLFKHVILFIFIFIYFFGGGLVSDTDMWYGLTERKHLSKY